MEIVVNTTPKTTDSGSPTSPEHHPVVSIGLPVYNGENFLREALRSLLAQSFKDFEIILSDNCSTDETARFCEEFAASDPRIHFHRNPRNLGAAANYNRVVELAKGKFFVWANHDDLWGESYLEQCVAALEANPRAILAYSRSVVIDEKGLVLNPLISDLKLTDASPARRLRRFHSLIRQIDFGKNWDKDGMEGLWIPIYGVMRTDQLLQTRLIGPYITSDTILLEELLMDGAFIEVEDTLFLKRDHPDRSMRAYAPSSTQWLNWFAGEGSKGDIFPPRYRLFIERLRIALRAPIPVSDRLGCLQEMLRYHIWRRF